MIQLRMELLGVSTAELLELENLEKGRLSKILKIGDCDRKDGHKGHRVRIEVKTFLSNADDNERSVTFFPIRILSMIFQAVNCFPQVDITATTKERESISFPMPVLPAPGMKVLIQRDFWRNKDGNKDDGDYFGELVFEIEEVTENLGFKLKEPQESEMIHMSPANKERLRLLWKDICARYPNGMRTSNHVYLITPSRES